jgi:tripartite-type tricarboxylate transporter receptor subunit TctC
MKMHIKQPSRPQYLTRRALLAGGAATIASPARSQAKYPDRPVKIVVPFGPGGLADVTARAIAEKLGEKLGQQFIIVNQPGAGGSAAARVVLSAPADGYTFALFTNGTAISVPLVSTLGYDPLTQFTPVSSLGYFDFLFMTSADHPYQSLQDVLKTAKAKPGVLNIGTINVGSSQNLAASLFKTMAEVDMTIVPFRTTPDATTALLRKDVDIVIDGYVAFKGLLSDGKLKALATSGPARFSGLPDVPTAAEAGVAGFNVTSWNALFAPTGTPAEIIRNLNEAIASALADTGVKIRLLALGIEAKGSTPQEIGERLKSDITRWGDVMTKAGIARQ